MRTLTLAKVSHIQLNTGQSDSIRRITTKEGPNLLGFRLS